MGLISIAHATPPPFYKYKGDAAEGHFEYMANVMEDIPWSKARAGWWKFKILMRKKKIDTPPNPLYLVTK